MPGGLDGFDLQDAEQDRRLLHVVDQYLDEAGSPERIRQQLDHIGPDSPLAIRLAALLARSKALLSGIEQDSHVSVVFAMYREQTRMLRPDQHPHGEDFITRKVEQLQWLFDQHEPATWSMYMVDDGCPEDSGHIARRIVNERCPDAPVQVLFLEDAIHARLPIVRPMRSTSDSQKGGSIVYGLWTAAQVRHDRHILVFTDADLSVHLGQTGLLIDGIVRGNKNAAIGSRREPDSVTIKTGHRDSRGRLFIYLWKGLLEPLSFVTDTQCGFKAFTAETLRDLFADLREKRFAFDIEMLLLTELRRSAAIRKVPIAWIDSEAASTTAGLQPYLSMLKTTAGLYREYLPPDPQSDRLAGLIESMTEAEWATLAGNVPASIADGDPSRFDSCRGVTVDDLEAVFRS